MDLRLDQARDLPAVPFSSIELKKEVQNWLGSNELARLSLSSAVLSPIGGQIMTILRIESDLLRTLGYEYQPFANPLQPSSSSSPVNADMLFQLSELCRRSSDIFHSLPSSDLPPEKRAYVRHWYAIQELTLPKLWENLTELITRTTSDVSRRSNLPRLYGWFKIISWTDRRQITDVEAQANLSTFREPIRDLMIAGCSRLTKGALLALAERSEDLQTLDLEWTQTDDEVLNSFSRKCLNLRQLSLAGTQVTEAAVWHLLSQNMNPGLLLRLALGQFSQAFYDGLQTSYPRIRLDIGASCSWDSAHMIPLASSSMPSSSAAGSTMRRHDTPMTSSRSEQQIQTMDWTSSVAISRLDAKDEPSQFSEGSDDNLNADFSTNRAQTQPMASSSAHSSNAAPPKKKRLRVLNLSGGTKVPFGSEEQFQAIDWSNRPEITDAEAQEQLSQIQGLIGHLNLAGCFYLSNATLRMLADKCKNLTLLNLAGTRTNAESFRVFSGKTGNLISLTLVDTLASEEDVQSFLRQNNRKPLILVVRKHQFPQKVYSALRQNYPNLDLRFKIPGATNRSL